MTEVIELETPEPEAPAPSTALPRWKKILLIGAGTLVAVGLALLPFQSGNREDLSTSTAQTGGQGQAVDGSGALIPTGDPSLTGTGPNDPNAAGGELSPALMKLGFSFFAAFAVGLAFRSFLKLALVFAGLQLIALFGLSYMDWVTVNWETMSNAFDVFVAKVQREAGSFQTLVTGSLPQAGLATLGLVAGFKK